MPVRADGTFEREVTSRIHNVKELEDADLIRMAAIDFGALVCGGIDENFISPSANDTEVLLKVLFDMPWAEHELIEGTSVGKNFTEAEINRRAETFRELGSRLAEALVEKLDLPYQRMDIDG